MKKKLTAAALLLTGVFTFAACSSRVPVTLTRNWNVNTTAAYDNTFYERLVYDVRYTEPEASLNGLHYENVEGSYTVTTEADDYYRASDNLTVNQAYRMETVLTFSADIVNSDGETVYSFGGDSGVPADSVVTTVYFRDIGDEMRPLESRVETYSHTPMQNGNIAVYKYTATVEYSSNAGSADIETVDLSEEITEIAEDEDRAYVGTFTDGAYSLSSLTEDYSCFDNAQLLFTVRGLDFSEGDSHTVTAVSGSGGAMHLTLSCTETVSSNYSFTLDGAPIAEDEEGAPVSTNVVTFSLRSGTQTLGVTHTVRYAAKSSTASQNTYRNLPMRIETPMSYSMGTLLYVLQSAEHTAPAE